jgi:hypothetical protein
MSVSYHALVKSDLDRMLRNHALQCDQSHSPQSTMHAHRLHEIERVLERIAYRDWKITTGSDAGVAWLQVDDVTARRMQGDGPGLSLRIDLCPMMTDEFIIDALFELIKDCELRQAVARFTVEAEPRRVTAAGAL